MDLRVGEQAAAGDVVGYASESGLEKTVTFAVVFSRGRAAGLEVMLAEAGAVVLLAPRIEGEVDVTGFGVAALQFYKGPDAGGGAEPACEGEEGEGEGDAPPENVIPDAIGCDDTDPEFVAIVGVARTEGEEFVFGVIDHVFAISARAGQTSSSQTTAVRRGEADHSHREGGRIDRGGGLSLARKRG